VRASVVEVLGTVEGSGDTSYGTGFAVRDGSLVVTNAHVLRGVKSPMVRTWDGALLASVEVLLQDDAIDLGVLRVKGLRAEPLAVADGPVPPVGTRVVAVGHPRGYEFTVSDGIVSAARTLEEGGPELIQTTAPISPGSSGGPLLDMAGRVVGVCSLTLTEGQNINFAVPAARIAPALAQALDIERGLAQGDPERMPPDALAQLVRRHRESGDLARASDLVQRALGSNPKSLVLLLEAAEVAWSRGNYSEVEGYLARIGAVRPDWAPARQVRAALHAQSGRCKEAESEARAALAGALGPAQAAEAHAVLAECLAKDGRVEEALAHADAALTSEKIAALPDYHALRAFLLQARGRPDEADREALTALERANWDPLVVAALRERGLPRLVDIESKKLGRDAGATVVRGVVRNRGPVPLNDVTLTAEGRDDSGLVVATGTAKITPARLVPGQTGAFRIVLEGSPADATDVSVRVVDYRE
jgi:Tfp pilus assembly protein PilF